MEDAECKCFVGIITRLVNALNGGYFEDVVINCYSDSEQIGDIIINIMQANLHIESNQIKELCRKDLQAKGYSNNIIEIWLEPL